MSKLRFQAELEALEQLDGIALYGDPERIEEIVRIRDQGGVVVEGPEVGSFYRLKRTPSYQPEQRRPRDTRKQWLWLAIAVLAVLDSSFIIWSEWR